MRLSSRFLEIVKKSLTRRRYPFTAGVPGATRLAFVMIAWHCADKAARVAVFSGLQKLESMT